MEPRTLGTLAFPAIGLLLIVAFILAPVFSADTYILQNSGSGGGETTDCINLANQYQIILNSTNGDCYVRALANGNNISISTNSTHVIITGTGGSETTDCINLASQYQLILNSTNGDCYVKALAPSTGISLSSNNTHVIITNSAPDNTTCVSVGSFAEVYKDGECNFRDIKGSADILVTQGTNDITVDYNGTVGCDTLDCLTDVSLGSLANHEVIVYNSTSGQWENEDTRIGQSVGVVYASVTKTNIGTAFIDLYVTAFDMENQMRIDCRNFSQFMVIYQWDYVGTGSQNLRIVNANNNAEVLTDIGIIADQDAGSTGWGNKPSWCGDNPAFDSDIILEAQGKSTVAGDDPIMRGYKILVR